jgi:hypothetical protein
MKKFSILLGSLFLLFLVFSTANALIIDETIVKADNYWGAEPTKNYGDADVIGNDDFFDISKMVMSGDGDNVFFDIYTNYVDHIGIYGTELGDLFISIDGWSPYQDRGDVPYVDDQASNGEIWEYAFVLDNHLGQGGSWGLYSVAGRDDPNIVMANHGSGSYRDGQEVQYNGTDQALANGSWLVTDDYIRFAIANEVFSDTMQVDSIYQIGYHWTMSCANDVIEGDPVPEPSTMLLFGIGLIGLATFGRKKIKK